MWNATAYGRSPISALCGKGATQLKGTLPSCFLNGRVYVAIYDLMLLVCPKRSDIDGVLREIQNLPGPGRKNFKLASSSEASKPTTGKVNEEEPSIWFLHTAVPDPRSTLSMMAGNAHVLETVEVGGVLVEVMNGKDTTLICCDNGSALIAGAWRETVRAAAQLFGVKDDPQRIVKPSAVDSRHRTHDYPVGKDAVLDRFLLG